MTYRRERISRVAIFPSHLLISVAAARMLAVLIDQFIGASQQQEPSCPFYWVPSRAHTHTSPIWESCPRRGRGKSGFICLFICRYHREERLPRECLTSGKSFFLPPFWWPSNSNTYRCIKWELTSSLPTRRNRLQRRMVEDDAPRSLSGTLHVNEVMAREKGDR